MKINRTASPAVHRALAASVVVGASLLAAGCGQQGYSVIGVTGTNIGLDIGLDPATQTPKLALGYQRAEFAFVPTNRPSPAQGGGEDPKSDISGADESADVLMELRYGGSTGSQAVTDTSIYQRLAVGRTAVSQPGATALFAKGPDGTVDPNAAKIMVAATQIAQLREILRDQIVNCVLEDGGTVDAGKLQTLINSAVQQGKDRSIFVQLQRNATDEEKLRRELTGFRENQLEALKSGIATACP